MEPLILRRGKKFHKKVQTSWAGTIEEKTVRPEHSIPLNFTTSAAKHIRGRIDIFVDQIADFVTIVEIKSTDWNKVKTQNVNRLLRAHSNQMFRYIDKFLEIDQQNVCAAIIYPKAPKNNERKNLIESYYAENSFQILWWDETEPLTKASNDHPTPRP